MRDPVSASVALAVLFAVTVGACPALAGWPSDGEAVCVAPCAEVVTTSVSDGDGGIYLAWNDNRVCDHSSAYIQHLTRHGSIAAGWPPLGKPVCTAASVQLDPQLVADGMGGAIVVWTDSRTGGHTAFAERFAADGTALWDPAGVAVCTASGAQLSALPMSDGARGTYVVWQDRRHALNYGPPHHVPLYEPYAQHMDAAGTRAWGTLGVQVSDRPTFDTGPVVIGDGGSGLLVAWADVADIQNVQRLDVGGNRLLGEHGVTLTGIAYGPITSDGAGGMFCMFLVGASGEYDLYAQRVDGSGAQLWGAGGKIVASALRAQIHSELIGDGAGGAFLTWHDMRNDVDWDVYAQRITSAGDAATGWPENGLNLSPYGGFQIHPRMLPSNDGGFLVSWYDARSNAGDYDIYAQRVDADGTLSADWPAGGVAVCAASGDQTYPLVATDGAGGMLVAWRDYRSDGDVFAQRVRSSGGLGDSLTASGVPSVGREDFAIGSVFPNPAHSAALRVSLTLPNSAPAQLSLLDPQGRLVAQQVLQLAGGGRTTVSLATTFTPAPGVYLLRLDQFGRSVSRSVSIVK